ncbi:MAG TPA: Mammalian cell entry related domain protein [Mycobacterium sp.]
MTSLLRTSDESEGRILKWIGAAVVLVAVVITVIIFVNPLGRHPKGVISVTMDAPYVGQGVVSGTPLILHGVKVGRVTDILSLPGGHVRLNTELQDKPVVGLTDSLGIDFRPANYFGVTGINILPGDGGKPLRNGADLHITPAGNFALQALLYRLGELTHSVLTQRLINVIDRGTRYMDALDPLLETMITVSTTVTNVQTVSTKQLLRNATGINVALPGVMDVLIETGDQFLKTKDGIGFNYDEDAKTNPYLPYYDDKMRKQYDEGRRLLASNPDEFVYGRFKEWMRGASTDLFVKVGQLEWSHLYELFPIVDQLRTVTEVVPKLVPATDISDTIHEIRMRLERMYQGSGDQRALQVRLILDELPGVAAPLNLAIGSRP